MKRFLIMSFLIAAAWTPAMAQSQQPLRIKCGGSAYTDSKGQVWQADYGFNGGRTGKYYGTVSGTTDPKLYQTDRYSNSISTPLVYSFPVVTGTYHVNLYFAETNSTLQSVGARVFSVKMEGNVVFQNLDIYAAAGANTALVRGADVFVTDGQLTIEFDNVVQDAEIDAIEITQSVAMPQMRLTFIYPDGTPVNGSLNYSVTSSTATVGSAGVSLGGTQPLVSGQATCLLLNSPQVLGLVGPLNVNLSLTDASGKILWQLTLALNPSNVNFASVQSTTLQVVVQKT